MFSLSMVFSDEALAMQHLLSYISDSTQNDLNMEPFTEITYFEIGYSCAFSEMFVLHLGSSYLRY